MPIENETPHDYIANQIQPQLISKIKDFNWLYEKLSQLVIDELSNLLTKYSNRKPLSLMKVSHKWEQRVNMWLDMFRIGITNANNQRYNELCQTIQPSITLYGQWLIKSCTTNKRHQLKITYAKNAIGILEKQKTYLHANLSRKEYTDLDMETFHAIAYEFHVGLLQVFDLKN